MARVPKKHQFFPRSFLRADRLRELLKSEVTRALRSIKDPGMAGLLTVTDVEISADLKRATIYYSVLGSVFERLSTAKALDRCAGAVQHMLRPRISMKFVPRVSFVYDKTPERASHIDRLLNKIAKENLKP